MLNRKKGSDNLFNRHPWGGKGHINGDSNPSGKPSQQSSPDAFLQLARRRVLNPATPPDTLVFLLEILSERRMELLSVREVTVLLERWHRSDEVAIALYNYIGSIEMTSLRAYVHQAFARISHLSPEVQLALVRVLGRIGSTASILLLLKYAHGDLPQSALPVEKRFVLAYYSSLAQVRIYQRLSLKTAR